jgi:hypothetical protein
MGRFYKPSLWIPQHFLFTNPNLHHGLLGSNSPIGNGTDRPKRDTFVLRLASVFVGGLSQGAVEGSIVINLPQTEEVGYHLQLRIYRKVTQARGRTELE